MSAPERFYLCQTYKSGRLVVLDDRPYFDFTAAYNAAGEPRGPYPSGHPGLPAFHVLPGVCAVCRTLREGDDIPPEDTSVRLIVRTEGYHVEPVK